MTKQLLFDTKATEKDVVDFYRKTLAKSAWEATTEAPFKSGFKNMMIFRNPQKDLLTLVMDEIKGQDVNRIVLKHQSAAEVEEIEQRLKAEAEQLEIEKRKPLPKLILAIPGDAKAVMQSKTTIRFEVPDTRARQIAETWRTQFEKEGWEIQASRLEDKGGSIFIAKGRLHTVSLSYTDLRQLPAEVTIRGNGVELVRSAEAKK